VRTGKVISLSSSHADEQLPEDSVDTVANATRAYNPESPIFPLISLTVFRA